MNDSARLDWELLGSGLERRAVEGGYLYLVSSERPNSEALAMCFVPDTKMMPPGSAERLERLLENSIAAMEGDRKEEAISWVRAFQAECSLAKARPYPFLAQTVGDPVSDVAAAKARSVLLAALGELDEMDVPAVRSRIAEARTLLFTAAERVESKEL